MGQNRTLKAKHLVVTFPVPQVIELFDRSDLTLDSSHHGSSACRSLHPMHRLARLTLRIFQLGSPQER